MDTDNFAYIIRKRKERYEANAQWDKEATETHKKVGNWLLVFILVGYSAMIIRLVSYLLE